MGEKTILIVSTITIFSFLLLSTLCFIKAASNRIYLWLGLLFFSPLLAFVSNLLIYFHQGNAWMFHASMLMNLSWGGYLIMVMNNLGKRSRKRVNLLIFLPSISYLPFIVYSLFNPQPIQAIVSNEHLQGLSIILSFVYNFLIIGYSLSANLVLLFSENRLTKPHQESRLKKEMLSIMLVLQACAFIPYLFKLDIIYIILYMPVFGQLFFIYLFFRLSTQKAPKLHSLVKEKYAGLDMEDVEQDELKKQIVSLMEEKKFYLVENSSLKAMAQLLNETPNRVSMIINSRFNRSYSDFINGYRIKLAIEQLTTNNNKLSMEGLAFECGFGNRNSFYQAFKKVTGTTPSAYLKQ